jgi:SAM-dependent methyltransferase
MSFTIGAAAYDRFMGRCSRRLSPQFAELASIGPGCHVLDVGCGSGALTAELVDRVGAESVTAVDPAAPMATAVRKRHPGIDVRVAKAEQLPFGHASFDPALAQLVVHFMADPVAGLRERARTTRAEGVVAACVWDHAGEGGPLAVFWEAARRLDPAVEDEGHLPGARDGHLAELFRSAGFTDIADSVLKVDVEHPTFDEWWEPFTLGVGPAGSYTAGLAPHDQAALRDLCRQILPAALFTLTARAWAVRATVTEAPETH